ncbi:MULTISPECIES: TRAP transporter small permease [Sinorhizobium]|uniref:TRAP transporter small permease protein n=1 Tax=Sinorhizobium medicae TaxID=110321 RepID=A0A508X9Q2_9HYPH|nr:MULTISPECIES: TRAP transporter small permease [Sinorhizobium]MDW9766425.1 TRAP transporter small permease subunit [Sinorhizobium meliloti]MDW9988881.1 TRAP transporter small permease subunit [Sinorhizobium meliloti]MDX0243392.1 TRAP transporter small permease subunit [Sinorhizobium meliloti]MDX0399227.1 TRAP transporter small permease subunit [Sinorhizobium meliloti]RVP08768.1 TRAP transporter small permease [Sinorhizobium meliloti]
MRSLPDRVAQIVDEVVPALLTAFIIVLVAADVLLRNALGRTVPYGIELSTYAFVWMVFLGAAGASRKGVHFQVDLFQERLPERVSRGLAAAAQIFCAVVALVMTHTSWEYAMRSWNRTSEGMELPLGYFYMVFPASFGLMAFAHALHVWRALRKGRAS